MAYLTGKAESLRKRVGTVGVIPVLVLDDVARARPLAEALVAGGLDVLEVTLRTPNALAVITEMARVEGVVVGSGTVRTLTHMRQSEDAGCQFMVSPGAPACLLEDAEKVSIPLLPGVGSPTEAMAAAQAGYSFLKFFPAEALGGVRVLKALQSPFSDLSFCPTGGISLKNIRGYLDLSNVVCVGGSWVAPPGLVEAGDYRTIENLAREARALAG